MNNTADNVFGYIQPEPETDLKTNGREQQGPLNGVKIAVRPNISVSGWPSEAGSKALLNYRPVEDAPAVKHLKNSGVRIEGMSKMSELGFGIAGETSHRLVLEKKCNAILATDAIGEARHLSALAGAWGYKPSFGVCSAKGMICLIPSFECISVIADTFFQMKAVLSVICRKDDQDVSILQDDVPEFAAAAADRKENGKTVIGIVTEQINSLDAGDKAAFDNALAKLAQNGIVIRNVDFPDMELAAMVHRVCGSTEASSAAGKYDGVRFGHRAKNAANWNEMYLNTRRESFETTIKEYLFTGAFFQFNRYDAFEHACRLRSHFVKKMQKLFETVDFIASPARQSKYDATAAGSISDVYGAFALTLPANVAGLPSLCAPGRVVAGSGDLGLLLTGAHCCDEKLVSFAMQQLMHS